MTLLDAELRRVDAAVAAAADEGKTVPAGQRLFNRELSWLEFDRRVLEEATDPANPLLERLKFLSIFSTNLDEFFMIRVSGLKERVAEGLTERSPDGMTAAEQLSEIRARLAPMLKLQGEYLSNELIPELRTAGISIEPYDTLDDADQKKLKKYFRENLFPILTPQSVDKRHPFPYISNLSLNIGLYVEPEDQAIDPALKQLFKRKRFARVKLPPSAPRLIPVGKDGRYVLLEEVVAANAGELFPNMKVGRPFLFRVTRDADIEVREDEAGDLLRSLEKELQRRRDRFPVRLEVDAAMPDKMLKMLAKGVGLAVSEVEKVDGIFAIPGLMQLYRLNRPELKDAPFVPDVPTAMLKPDGVFETLKHNDVLLHHPYTSFNAVNEFISEAADDPDVQAIKICLYRTGKHSPIVDSLIRASRAGKQVTALVELLARFDEENNIEWARRLESEGVHVVYGISGLKTHGKVLLVVRREKDRLVRYVHVSTGNYNRITARTYTDLGLLTSNEEIASDATALFNFLTGYSQPGEYKRLIVAPTALRDRLIALIRRERKHKAAKRPARIVIKVNSLTDDLVIEELYRASQAGVEIDLIVRGICCLRPGVKGLSENIRVRSVVGRFLEHSRVFYFANGGKEEIFLGSSDIMPRNFDRRVEVLTPVLDTAISEYLRETVLDAYLRDEVNARLLTPDGTYLRIARRQKGGFDSQFFFLGLPTPG
jgi:polyphosphate kinase